MVPPRRGEAGRRGQHSESCREREQSQSWIGTVTGSVTLVRRTPEASVPATIRSAASRVNFVVGPLVVLIGLGAALTAVILPFVLGTAWFLMLLLPALLGIGAGLFILWMARRARLQIDARGFTWCGFVGAEHSLRWEELDRLLPPGESSSRVVAVAQLRDGRQLEVEALWNSATAPAALFDAQDHSRARNALLGAHRAWLAGRR